jgi:hypothetical protein
MLSYATAGLYINVCESECECSPYIKVKSFNYKLEIFCVTEAKYEL